VLPDGKSKSRGALLRDCRRFFRHGVYDLYLLWAWWLKLAILATWKVEIRRDHDSRPAQAKSL
jgi:hypothetical protein